MSRLKKHFFAISALSVLGIVGAIIIMSSHQAAAQGPPNGLAVNIVNPIPLPASGSTSVSGTVAATQSGTWNVGIPETVSVKNIDEPGRSGYQQRHR